MNAGLDPNTAYRLSLWYLEKNIKQQIEWLGRRSSNGDRLSILRRSIEETWPEPDKLD
jgi:hypothetical protein